MGRPLPGEDHISGLVFYNDNYPSGFDVNNEIKVVYSLEEAEALGITEGSANHALEWYQIREFFRVQPKGVLYVGIFPVPAGAYDFAEVAEMQSFAEGKIRQVGVECNEAGVAGATVTTLNGVLKAQADVYRPLSGLISFDISGTADLSALADLRAQTDSLTSVVIGADQGAKGKALATSEARAVNALGACLGAFAFAKVNESIAWPSKFQMSTESELDVVGFGNGDLWKDKTVAELDAIHDKGYIFLKKHEGITGSYFNDSSTCVVATNDFAYQEANRTIDKASRLVYGSLIQDLNGPITVDADSGQLSEDYLSYLKGQGDAALGQMAQNEEVSGYQTLIDPSQNVLSSGEVIVSIEVVPIGVGREITVKIGLKVSLS